MEVYLQRMLSCWQLTAHSFKAVPSSCPALEGSALAQSLEEKERHSQGLFLCIQLFFGLDFLKYLFKHPVSLSLILL